MQTGCLSLTRLQVARFPFKGNMSLVVVLPFSGEVNVSALARSLDAEQLYRHFPKERPIQVSMPKLNVEYSQDLTDTLTSMGKRGWEQRLQD